jgi:hypothetical protein
MRFLTIAVAVSALALATGAFAQTAPRSAPPPVATGEAQLPRWDKEDKIPYKPCPTSVVLADGRHVCLGCPTVCGAHF